MKLKDKKTGQFVATHKSSRHPLYKTFITMHARCKKPTNPKYYRYGGRGITVCDRWEDINKFIEDMGEKPTKLHTLNRINNDGNYEPSNCKWSTPVEQMNNRGILGSNTSGYNGVSYNKRRQKWMARRVYNKKSYNLGAYATPEEAAKAVKEFEGTL